MSLRWTGLCFLFAWLLASNRESLWNWYYQISCEGEGKRERKRALIQPFSSICSRLTQNLCPTRALNLFKRSPAPSKKIQHRQQRWRLTSYTTDYWLMDDVCVNIKKMYQLISNNTCTIYTTFEQQNCYYVRCIFPIRIKDDTWRDAHLYAFLCSFIFLSACSYTCIVLWCVLLPRPTVSPP